jgi:hypothetical protein
VPAWRRHAQPRVEQPHSMAGACSHRQCNTGNKETRTRLCSRRSRPRPSRAAPSHSPCGRWKMRRAAPCACMAPTRSQPRVETAHSIAGACSHRPCNTRNKENAHLALFSAFTSAPFSSSAFTISVWPLEDARCSAVCLHGADTLSTTSRTAAQPLPALAAIAHSMRASNKTSRNPLHNVC